MLFTVKRPYGKKPCEEAFEDTEKYRWCININSLEELMYFVHKYKRIIIDNKEDLPEIIIYDGYIE